MARGLKFLILAEEGLYYLCSGNKGPDQLRNSTKVICAFVFAYAKIQFSHDPAHFITDLIYIRLVPRSTTKTCCYGYYLDFFSAPVNENYIGKKRQGHDMLFHTY